MDDEPFVDTALPEVVAWVSRQIDRPATELTCERFTTYKARVRDSIASRFAPTGWDTYYDYDAYAFGQMNRGKVVLVVREKGELVRVGSINDAHLFSNTNKVDRFVVYSTTKTTLIE